MSLTTRGYRLTRSPITVGLIMAGESAIDAVMLGAALKQSATSCFQRSRHRRAAVRQPAAINLLHAILNCRRWCGGSSYERKHRPKLAGSCYCLGRMLCQHAPYPQLPLLVLPGPPGGNLLT